MKIHKIQIDNKDVFISQRDDSFKVVKPMRNEDGSVNWFNLLTGGSWWNIIIVAIVVVLILGLLYEYSLNVNLLLECLRTNSIACQEAFGYAINIVP